MKTLIDQIAAQYEAFSTNANAQIEKNNKAAGVRARKAALELTKLLKDFRKMSVDEAKKSPYTKIKEEDSTESSSLIFMCPDCYGSIMPIRAKLSRCMASIPICSSSGTASLWSLR